MFNSPDELLRADMERVAQELQTLECPAGKAAVRTFLSSNPSFQDYLDLVHHSLSALTIYNEVALETATGPNPDGFLAERAVYAAGALKEMRVAFDRVVELYGFMLD